MKSRLIAIILHGGGPYYLEPLLAQGRVPTFARLRASGSRRRLITPYPLSASSWVTILTGQSTATHGVLDYLQVDARSYHPMTVERVETPAYRDRTIFAPLGAHGRRVASIYLPMTYPPFPIDGVMVSGFPTPNERQPDTWPPEFGRTMGPLNRGTLARLRYERSETIRDYLDYHLDRVTATILDACRDTRYDVVLGCLALPDLAHHYFWRADTPAALEPIYQVYEKVDAAIGRVLETVSERDFLVAFSDHGGCAAPSRQFAVNRWLQQEGDLQLASPALDRLGGVDVMNALVRGARRLRLNQRLAPFIGPSLRSRLSAVTQNDAFVDWSRTRAYGMNFFYPLVGVEINLAGRQARGIVTPGREHESLIAELSERLTRLEDPATGRRVCHDVRRGAEMFAGPHVDRFPDIVGVMDRDYDARTQLTGAVFGRNELQWEYPYMGYHHEEGLFVARGPGISAGSTQPDAHLVDVAPTLLHLAGVPAPAWMEGRVFPL